MRTIVFIVSLFMSAFALASTCTRYQTSHSNGSHATPAAACTASMATYLNQSTPGLSWSLASTSNGQCRFKGTYVNPNNGRTEVNYVNLDYFGEEGPCGSTQCEAQQGEQRVVNWTVGYTRSPNIDTDPDWKLIGPPNVIPSNGLLCNPKSPCELRFDGFSSDDKAWQSASPTPNGLYRVSLDVTASFTGSSCTPTNADVSGLSTTAPIPECPGFVGEVNGVQGCYGTASNPTSNDPTQPKPAQPQSGNPAAGEKPTSGEGSGSDGAGRTPSTGNGGPAGGPAAAAGSGTKPDGTTPKPDDGKEQANCGAPGQPKCGIDEGGTPSKFDGDKAALDKWKTDMDANRATIKDADGGFFDAYNVFFAAPPFVPCEPIELPNDVLLTRQCDVVDGTRSVMAYIWALAALWICLGWIREAI